MPGSIKGAIDALCALEQTINAQVPAGELALTFHRWRPQALPDLPSLWNWLVESPQDKRDVAHVRDRLDVRVQIGVRHTDVEEQMAQIELYADAYRATVYPALEANCTLDGTVDRAVSKSMRTALDRFQGIDLLCVEFSIELHLITSLHPT